MKKKSQYALILFVFLSSPVFAKDILGEYVTKPEIYPGIVDDGSKRYKEFYERMTWTLSITKDQAVLYTKNSPNGVTFEYEIIDKLILCTFHTGLVEKHEPLYIDKNDSLHGMSTIFFKKEKKRSNSATQKFKTKSSKTN